MARAPGRWYKIRKLVRRRRLEVTAAGAVLLAILAGLVFSTYLMFRMQRERDVARWAEYKATLAAAFADIQQFRSREAIQALERCPSKFRGWEWNYLYALADTSRSSITIGTSSSVARLGFAGDDSRLVVAHGKTVQIWNLESTTREASYGPLGEILAMTRDGSRILSRPANNDRENIEVIEPATRTRLSVLTGHKDPIVAAAFSRDGLRAAAATREGDIRVWQVGTGKLIRAIRSPTRIQTDTPADVLALNSDGSRVVFASLVSALVWDVDTGNQVASLEHSDCTIQNVSLTAQDRLLSASQAVRLWDLRTAQLIKMWLPRVATCVRTAAASEDGSLIATIGWMGELELWSADRDRPIASIYGAAIGQPVALAFSPEGRYLVALSQAGRLKVWDARTAGNLTLRWGNAEEVVGIGLSPDGTRVIAAYQHGVELLDAITGRRLAYNPIAVTALAVHPKTGEIAVALENRTVSFWTPELKPTGATAGPFSGPVTALAFDPVRRYIAGGTESGAIEIWNLERGTQVSSTPVDYRVNHMAYTPDGNLLAVAVGDSQRPPRSGAALRILDGATGRQVSVSTHPEGRPRAFLWLAFSPDGKRILTGSCCFGTAALYDLSARKLERSFGESERDRNCIHP